ncbi:hypothetical protein Tco_0204389 [Tanacetum coccineum]
MKVVQEEEIAIDAIPLATKPPTIVDWKIVTEGKKIFYLIIRANGQSKRGGLLGLKDFLSAVGITSKCSRLMLKLLLLNTMIKTAEVSYCCLEKLLLLSIITIAGIRVNAAEGLLLLEDLMLSEKIARPYQRKDKDDLKIKIRICYL